MWSGGGRLPVGRGPVHRPPAPGQRCLAAGGLDADLGPLTGRAHAGRRITRIEPDGSTSTAYTAQRPWSPIGVTTHDGALYILERLGVFNGADDVHVTIP